MHRFADRAVWVAAAHFLWLNTTGTRAKRTPSRFVLRRRSPIENRHSGTSGFSRLWRFPAAKSSPPAFNAITAGVVHSLQPSTVATLEAHEDPKLGLTAQMLRGGCTVRLKAWGTSMLPSLWPGDLLTIQSAAQGEVVPGDIVLVLRDDRFVIHRLVEARRDGDRLSLITRGDGIPQNDPAAAASELLGRVARVCRANRSFAPTRRLSLLQSALARVLCHWGRLRNLTLRIYAVRRQADLTRFRRIVRSLFSEASPSRTPHP